MVLVNGLVLDTGSAFGALTRVNFVHVLHAARGHWTPGQMRHRIMELAEEWRVDLVIIEDTAGCMSLIPDLKEESGLNVIGRTPNDDKVTRLLRHEGRFEAGRIVLPQEASWLADFERELLAFPYGRHDDQVDALLLALDYYAERLPSLRPLDFDIDIDSFWRPSPWRIGESPDEAF